MVGASGSLTRATYDEPQAIDALTHVTSFFELLAKRLKEI
jgi:hypothetical protein